ncbi:MAG: DUF3313 domain-containing protein [Gammaproteobacteria bacterium]|jgi:hypothetical protein|nr:DUF3313 domain-containing protein [Gammaproteobacteria bacterium]
MTRVSSIRLGLLVLVAAAASGCGPQPTQPKPTGEINIEGLQQVPARNFEAAFVRPGVTFADYSKLMVDELELAFRTPDREQNQFPLDEDQKTRFRAAMATAFGEELGKLQNVEVVTEPGPDVLSLHVRVQDIVARAPGRRVGAGGRAGFALETVGEMTLVLELRDSESNEVLVRVFDRQAVEGAAMVSGDSVVSTWQGVERLVGRWASRAREGLDRLLGGSY